MKIKYRHYKPDLDSRTPFFLIEKGKLNKVTQVITNGKKIFREILYDENGCESSEFMPAVKMPTWWQSPPIERYTWKLKNVIFAFTQNN